MIYMFCADGLEEVEALATLDVIRRAGLPVTTVGVCGKTAEGPHKIKFFTDITLDEFKNIADKTDAVILPGGGVGTQTLYENETVCEAVKKTAADGGLVCAICAAPSILGRLRLLQGKTAVCYPGFEKYLYGANVSAERVVTDGNFITAAGMGCAVRFGLAIVAALLGEEKAAQIAASIML
ncbi:MAG: DJ-1/PfpI family protein [Clostridia bacterium]|nr:DJ-1/PfpI family protein [Clostridia bacterium]